MKYSGILLLFFLFFAPSVFSAETPYIDFPTCAQGYAVTNGQPCTQATSLNNTHTALTNTSIGNPIYIEYRDYTNAYFGSLPDDAIVQGFIVTVRASGTTGVFMYPAMSTNTGTSYASGVCLPVPNDGDPHECAMEMTGIMQTKNLYVRAQAGVTASYLKSNASTFRFRFSDYGGANAVSTVNIDYVRYKIVYTLPNSVTTNDGDFWAVSGATPSAGIASLKSAIETRAPFAYVDLMLDLNPFNPGYYEYGYIPPTITIPLTDLGFPDVVWNPATVLDKHGNDFLVDFFAPGSVYRITMSLLIYIMYVVYTLLILRRII